MELQKESLYLVNRKQLSFLQLFLRPTVRRPDASFSLSSHFLRTSLILISLQHACVYDIPPPSNPFCTMRKDYYLNPYKIISDESTYLICMENPACFWHLDIQYNSKPTFWLVFKIWQKIQCIIHYWDVTSSFHLGRCIPIVYILMVHNVHQ